MAIEGFTMRRGERKGVNETPRRGGSVVVCSFLWTDSLFIAVEVGLRRRAQRNTPRLARVDRALSSRVVDLARSSVGSQA